MIKDRITKIVVDSLKTLEMIPPVDFSVEHPKVKEHGDYSTNVAMVLAKQEKISPRELAAKLVSLLSSEQEFFEKVEIKGPGFINFFLKAPAYHEALRSVWVGKEKLAKPQLGAGKRVLIEFVSANPTGPMHVGHGRNAVVGDTLARLLEAVGYEVTREFYVNDHGVQIKTLGASGSHYHQVLTQVGDLQAALPEDMYRGAYLEELVARVRDKIEPVLEDPLAVGKILGVELLKLIKEDLQRLGVSFEKYFSESSLYQEGKIDKALALLKESAFTYERDGALWFKTSDFGDDKDRVLIKSDNTYTYLTPDIAYHQDKFERQYDLYINVMGADHGGYVKRLKASVRALGNDPDQLEFLLMQMVNLKRGEKSVSMSKRSGAYVTLHEVLDEVGLDATRYFFLMRSHNATLDFDLELAKQETPENPVFYIQYAHARISSIFRKALEAGYPEADEIVGGDLSPLSLPEEMDLIKAVLVYPEVLESSAVSRDPHRIAFYLLDLAKTFQNYYTKGKTDERYRVIVQDQSQTLAKLFLLKTLRELFRLCLNILGVSAPDRMEKTEVKE